MQKKLYVPIAAVIGLLFVGVGLVAAQGGDPKRGAELYAANCAVCHGPEGKGRIGVKLLKDFPSINETAFLVQTITNGVEGSRMPAWSQAKGGPLSDQDIADVAAYVAGLLGGSEPVAPAPTAAVVNITPAPGVTGDPNAGAVVFAQNCAVCHGERGQGRIGVTLVKDWPAINPSAYIRATVEKGVEGTLMPTWLDQNGGPLTAKEIDDVSAFIVSLGAAQPSASPTVAPTATPVQPGGGAIWIGWVAAVVVVIVIATALVMYSRRKA